MLILIFVVMIAFVFVFVVVVLLVFVKLIILHVILLSVSNFVWLIPSRLLINPLRLVFVRFRRLLRCNA